MKLRRTTTAPEIDKAVTLALVGHLGAIFATDYLFMKYRKTRRNGEPRITRFRPNEDCPSTYSSNTRHVRALQVFFWYLAVHMTVKFKYDPLVWLTNKLGGEHD